MRTMGTVVEILLLTLFVSGYAYALFTMGGQGPATRWGKATLFSGFFVLSLVGFLFIFGALGTLG